MAGDGGRAPDVSEQRAEIEANYSYSDERGRLLDDIGRLSAPSDPASVLAALLAEHPDATIAALETLLTSDEVLDETAAAFSALDHLEAVLPHSERSGPYEYARFMFDAACRSLRPKAPKEDRDA